LRTALWHSALRTPNLPATTAQDRTGLVIVVIVVVIDIVVFVVIVVVVVVFALLRLGLLLRLELHDWDYYSSD